MNDPGCEQLSVDPQVIRNSPLGEELSDAQCAKLAETMTACAIHDQQFLIEEGHKDDTLHVLTRGNMEVVSHTGGGEFTSLHILREGDMLGAMGFIDGIEHSAGLRAMGNCELLRLDRTEFEELLYEDPDLVYKVMRAIVRSVHRILCNMNFQQVELTNYITKLHGRY